MRNILLLIISLIFFSCNDVVLPKPKAYLSLEYPKKEYKELGVLRPYTFDVLKSATIVEDKNNWLKITYPKLKASIDITYRPIENNLKELLT
jgi:gliding motility-associated lipoprotein GldD